jgi:hypothetical protein
MIARGQLIVTATIHFGGTESTDVGFPIMSYSSDTTVWDLIAALSSDAHELRLVAPAEFELVEVTTEQTSCSGSLLNGDAATERSASASAES